MRSQKEKGKIISARLYKKILEVMPVSCVDVVVAHKGSFLLCQRKNKPAKGAWWFVGGRVFKNETLEKAVKRKVREETGIKNLKIKKFLTTKSMMFKNSAFGPSTHSINLVFLVEVQPKLPIVPDSQSSEIRWFSKIDAGWPTYVKEMLRLAGFK